MPYRNNAQKEVVVSNLWLIKKAWADSMENSSYRAFGYDVLGYATTEELSLIDFTLPAPKGWATPEGALFYIKETLPSIKEVAQYEKSII